MTDATTNGFHPAPDGLNASAATTPAAIDSPATPVSTELTDAVKIRVDLESDPSRHADPVSVKQLDVASVQPEAGTPVDPDTIPIDPPKGTPPPLTGELLPDVEMAESSHPPTVNSSQNDVEMEMEQKVEQKVEGPMPYANGHTNGDGKVNGDEVSDATAIADSSSTASMASMRRSADAMEEDLPPAKRARMHSDADQASLNHFAAAPPPAASDSAQHTYHGASTLGLSQFKFCMSTVRSLRKIKDAGPFLRPVDPVALNIPHYPSIVKNPMDFSTVERKLTTSNPAKPDPNPANPRYQSAGEFIADVRMIFSNAELFNGPDHLVTAMGKRVEAVFDKQIKQLPPPDEPRVVPKKAPTPTPPPPPVKKVQARRPSTSVPTIRRSEENTGRPRREIHAPPPKDLPYAEPAKRTQRKRKTAKDDGTEEQLRFCGRVLSDLHKKQLWSIASPFYEPVDWVKLEIPNYPKIVKKPMDMSTMRKKLDTHEYSNAQRFHDDFKLMIRNCFLFNPAGTPVNQAGIELQRLFDEKWRGLPALHDVSDADDDEEEEEEDDERSRKIATMETQMEMMRANIERLKNEPPPEKKKKEKKRPSKPIPQPVASTSKAPKATKTSTTSASVSKPSKKSKKLADEDTLSFDQKKDLSEAIGALDGAKLEKVIQIIHEGVPEIRDSTEEIELEIDSLPAAVLTKLYNFVLRPQRAAAAASAGGGGSKRNRAGKGGGTGGLKRKSMDEDVEAEKIRQLEERMRLFEGDSGGGSASAPPVSGHSSDSSSGSDSSGSDSE